MYKALDLSKYIVSKCIDDQYPITNLQLQKILYYIQKDFLNRGEPAFSDDIEAWQFGPVVPCVYYRFSGNGAMPIIVFFDKKFEIKSEDKMFIDPIIEEKRKLYPWDLVAETHKKGGAWDQTFAGGKGNHKKIDIELIRRYG